jgi:hypothetical protein
MRTTDIETSDMQKSNCHSFTLKISLTSVETSVAATRRYFTVSVAQPHPIDDTYFATCGPLDSEELAHRIQALRKLTNRRMSKLRWRLTYQDEFSIHVAASFRMLEDFGFVASESAELSTVIGGILQPRKKSTQIKVGASGFTTA